MEKNSVEGKEKKITKQIRRCFRPCFKTEGLLTKTLLAHEQSFLSNIFFLSESTPLSYLSAYKLSLIQGISLPSAFVCQLLNPKPGESILDLCCAPGVKLSYLADLMQREGCLVGVDNNERRVSLTSSVLRKYNIGMKIEEGSSFDLSVFSADGTIFSRNLVKKDQLKYYNKFETSNGSICLSSKVLKDINCLNEYCKITGIGKKRLNKSNRNRIKKKMEKTDVNALIPEKFDKVLVDAECSSDGSFSHSSSYKRKREVDKNELENLQRDLLLNGLRNLRIGGTLVYSTCSFNQRENEDIVSWIMEQQDQKLLLLDIFSNKRWRSIPKAFKNSKCAMFTPENMCSSAMFVAYFKKLEEI
eukprot:snap_masked-scaffold_36-processed-gene-2.89-mRNA-1 protein AED:0.38 eAED:0.41 QI:0/-1/0/1/-1/1/1/0/358